MRLSHLLANDACKNHGFGSVNLTAPLQFISEHPDANQAGQSKSSQIIQSRRSVAIMSNHAARAQQTRSDGNLRIVFQKSVSPEEMPPQIGRKNHKADQTDSMGPVVDESGVDRTVLKAQDSSESFDKSMGSMKTHRFVGALRDLDGCLKFHTAQEYRLGTTCEFGFGIFGSTKGGQSDKRGVERLGKFRMIDVLTFRPNPSVGLYALGDLAVSSASSITPRFTIVWRGSRFPTTSYDIVDQTGSDCSQLTSLSYAPPANG
ncbi:hypothetical protein F5146DRAFT_1166708 [Armillaria mellea]|nr:hypothetical protein F5146DRAFT_1166708 [Armillaria mellea]